MDDARRANGTADPATVFVVHGRNETARNEMFNFLRQIGLRPLEWSQAVQATGKGSPYIGEVLDAAFASAQAVVVLLTPDEIAYLRTEFASGDDDPESNAAAQPRPNVLFEAGIATGRDSARTILVELGDVRPFSDIAGKHSVRLDDSAAKRKELAQRLRTAGAQSIPAVTTGFGLAGSRSHRHRAAGCPLERNTHRRLANASASTSGSTVATTGGGWRSSTPAPKTSTTSIWGYRLRPLDSSCPIDANCL